MTASDNDGYVHARTAEEYQRLKAQAKLWEEATARSLDVAGFGPGMSALDVGCGPGEAMRLMGARCGPSGHVTGLDIDGAIGRAAVAELNAAASSRYSFVEGSILGSADMPGAPFDLSFTRLTLMHLDDPAAALRRMRQWTRSGGHVVALEYDFAALDVEPRFPAMEEFERVFHGVFNASGRDLRSGRHLPGRFREAGLGNIVATAADAKFLPLKQFQAMLVGVYNGLLPAALSHGLTDETRATRFRAEIDEAAVAGAFAISPLLVTAVAKVD